MNDIRLTRLLSDTITLASFTAVVGANATVSERVFVSKGNWLET